MHTAGVALQVPPLQWRPFEKLLRGGGDEHAVEGWNPAGMVAGIRPKRRIRAGNKGKVGAGAAGGIDGKLGHMGNKLGHSDRKLGHSDRKLAPEKDRIAVVDVGVAVVVLVAVAVVVVAAAGIVGIEREAAAAIRR